MPSIHHVRAVGPVSARVWPASTTVATGALVAVPPLVVPPADEPPLGGVGFPEPSTGNTTVWPSMVNPADNGLGSDAPFAAAMMHVAPPLSACAWVGGQTESALAPICPFLIVTAVGGIDPSASMVPKASPPTLQPLPSFGIAESGLHCRMNALANADASAAVNEPAGALTCTACPSVRHRFGEITRGDAASGMSSHVKVLVAGAFVVVVVPGAVVVVDPGIVVVVVVDVVVVVVVVVVVDVVVVASDA